MFFPRCLVQKCTFYKQSIASPAELKALMHQKYCTLSLTRSEESPTRMKVLMYICTHIYIKPYTCLQLRNTFYGLNKV